MTSSENSAISSIDIPKVIKKRTLKFSDMENGLILKIHHSIKTEANKVVRIRFTTAVFSENAEKVAAIDHRGNVFIFDLNHKKYWQLPDKFINSSVIKFSPNHSDNCNILIGNKSGVVYEIEINSGLIVRCMKIFSSKINQILFLSSINGLLVVAKTGIKIYDLDRFDKKYEHSGLSGNPASYQSLHHQKFNKENFVNIVTLIPNSDNKFLICFTDDSINVCSGFSGNGLNISRQFNPFKLKEKYLMKLNNKVELIECNWDSNDEKLLSSVTPNYSRGLIGDVAFCDGGNYCVICCYDNSLLILSTTLWEIKKVVSIPDIQLKQINFCSNTLFIGLTSNNVLMAVDLHNLTANILIENSDSYKFSLSSNGKILADILTSGEIYLYNLDYHLAIMKKDITSAALVRPSVGKVDGISRLHQINQEINKVLPKSRLLPILNEFGEYPVKYRQMIWKTLLKLPQNENAFKLLLKRGNHSCVFDYGKMFPLNDKKQLSQLQKIVSALAYWSNVFGHVDYLPNFVFPFLRFFKSDALGCFETVATVLYNQCQLWFEFAPYELPYNYMGFVDNILSEFDPKLREFYREHNISTEIYAMPLMESAFSEVLDIQQWMKLWDHVLSNEPYFYVFCIVSFNIVQRRQIMKLDYREEIEYFFHEPNLIDSTKLIGKCYELMEKCPNDLHPRRFMNSFVPLATDDYQKFRNFPKNLLSIKSHEMDTLKEEQKLLDFKINELEALERTINDRMESQLISEEHAKRMKELELKYEEALKSEEERISYQRKLLLLYQRKIRERENEMLIEAKNSLLRKNALARENELEMLLKSLEREKARDEIELQIAEENIKLQEMGLLGKQLDYQNHFGHNSNESLSVRFRASLDQLKSQKEKFMAELNRIGSGVDFVNNSFIRRTNRTDVNQHDGDLSPEIDTIENIFHDIQNEYCRVAATESNSDVYENHIRNLEQKTELLERKIKQCLKTLHTN